MKKHVWKQGDVGIVNCGCGAIHYLADGGICVVESNQTNELVTVDGTLGFKDSFRRKCLSQTVPVSELDYIGRL